MTTPKTSTNANQRAWIMLIILTLLTVIGMTVALPVLARAIQGLTAGDLPALFAYLADITPPAERAKRFGLLGALSAIGTMIGPAIGGLLATVSVELPVFVTAGVGLVIATISIFLLPESLAPENRIQRLAVRDIQPLAVSADAFGRKELRSLLIGFGLLALPFGFFINNFSVLALDSIQWRPTEIGLLTAGVGIIDILIQGVLLGLLLPRIGERGVIISGIVAQMVGLAVVASILAQPWVFILGALLLAAGQGASQAAMDGAMSNAGGDDEQGWLGGVTQSLTAAMGTVSPLIVGALYAIVSPAAPYWLGVALMVIAVIGVSKAHIANSAKPARPAQNADVDVADVGHVAVSSEVAPVTAQKL